MGEHKHHEKEAEKDDKHHEKKKGGLLSFLHRDKSKKYSAEEEAEFDRQEREHNALAGHGHTSGAHHDDATHGTPLPEKPTGRDIGDKLHGVERNRGVTGATGFPDQPGFGDGTTGHQHSVSEATTDQQGHPVGSGVAGAGYGSHQAGREFPLGHSKHDSGYTDKNSPTHALSQHQSGHHTGRDAAAIGGAGLVGEHEYRKRE